LNIIIYTGPGLGPGLGPGAGLEPCLGNNLTKIIIDNNIDKISTNKIIIDNNIDKISTNKIILFNYIILL
jgi:hypothetical protein